MPRFRILDGGKIPPPPGPPNDPIDPIASITRLTKLHDEQMAALDEQGVLSARTAISALILSRGVVGAINFLKQETAPLEELARRMKL